ncbi:MAG: PEP-CTERM sorting domain-containing protein [Planctomycetaceae bacterium]|nr:PEP-CTERM sorting domain-containing protein [Planctomycetaceae bacterium]
MLGTNLEILINGVLLDEQYFNLSPDQLTSTWFEGYYLDISLDSLFADHLLVNGDNNIAFVIDTLAAEPKLPLHVADIGLVAFAADIGTGSRSTTPEPATMLIFGLGLVGLGLRRKLIRKMK